MLNLRMKQKWRHRHSESNNNRFTSAIPRVAHSGQRILAVALYSELCITSELLKFYFLLQGPIAEFT